MSRPPASLRLPREIRWHQLLIHLFLTVGCLVMAYPLIYCVLASISTVEDLNRSSWLPIPSSLYLEHYRVFFVDVKLVPRWLLNTLLRIAWYVLSTGAISILCGYIFARMRFRGRDTIFLLLLGSLLLPAITFQIPLYLIMARWPLAGGNNLFGQGGHGFINAWPALFLPGLVNAYYIFLLRQWFSNIPSDFEEAARIDGAGILQILLRVYGPMLKPIIIVMVIFQSLTIWNDYSWPLIAVSQDSELWPISLGFQRIMDNSQSGGGLLQSKLLPEGQATAPFFLTIATVGVAPMVLLFLFFQRYFLEGTRALGGRQ